MAAQLQPLSKRGSGRRRNQHSAAINVIPLVDVMLVLLIIFMVTAPMMTVGVPVDLPKTQAAQMNDSVEPLIISVNASGETYIQETLVPMAAMIDRLKAITNNNPETKIYVRGDQKIAYGKVMEVMGAIASAGFKKVSLIAELPH
jgi:biopolymer transport protein TolR